MKITFVFLFVERGAYLQTGIYDTFTKGNLCSVFRQKGGGQNVLPVSPASQLPLAQNNHYAK